MAKKIKFPLLLKNDIHVRTLEELRENFDFDKLTDYFVSGKLSTWLSDRYYEEESGQISKLSGNEVDFKKRIYDIFEIPYVEDDCDTCNLQKRKEKYEKIKRYSNDEKILSNIEMVATDQEELADLLDEEYQLIYLLEGNYKIPLSKKGVQYLGIGSVTVQISSKEDIDLEKLGIVFSNIILSCKDSVKIKLPKYENVTCVGAAVYLNSDLSDSIEVSLECIPAFCRKDRNGYYISEKPFENSERSCGPVAVALIGNDKNSGKKNIISLLTDIRRDYDLGSRPYNLSIKLGCGFFRELNELLKACSGMFIRKDEKVYFIKNCIHGDESISIQKIDDNVSELFCISLKDNKVEKIVDNTTVFNYIKENPECFRDNYRQRKISRRQGLMFFEIVGISDQKILMNNVCYGDEWEGVSRFVFSFHIRDKKIRIIEENYSYTIYSDDKRYIYAANKKIKLYNLQEEYTALLADKYEYPVTVKDNMLYYFEKSSSGGCILFRVDIDSYITSEVKRYSKNFVGEGDFEWKEDSLYIKMSEDEMIQLF